MPLDPQMPTLLRDSPGNLVQAESTVTTGTTTPLQPLSINTGGSINFAQAAINRIANSTALSARTISVGTQPHPLQQTQLANAPAANGTANGRQREMSIGNGNDAKRRRLNASLGPLPIPSVTTARHSSLGPGTPKATTPGGSRAGSVGPRPLKKTTSMKKPLVQQLSRKKFSKVGLHKKSARRLLGSSRASPSTTTGDESGESGSEEGEFNGENGPEDVDMEEGSDDTKYCYCRDVSHGDMIACDNANCEIQWFHWSCAGITSEPTGEWLCKECRKLPRDKIQKA
jgi:inhibitor of growth protein 3